MGPRRRPVRLRPRSAGGSKPVKSRQEAAGFAALAVSVRTSAGEQALRPVRGEEEDPEGGRGMLVSQDRLRYWSLFKMQFSISRID
jgi:hypothetical protein